MIVGLDDTGDWQINNVAVVGYEPRIPAQDDVYLVTYKRYEFAEQGSLTKRSCAGHTPSGLTGNAAIKATPWVDITQVNNFAEAEGDYLTAHVYGDILRLNLYRVAPRFPNF